MTNAPFGECKTADLHLADQIQSFGALVAINKRTHRICACSANTAAFVRKTPEELLGQEGHSLFTPTQAESIFKPINASNSEIPQIERMELHNQSILVASHSVNAITLVEIEPYASEASPFKFSDTQEYLRRLGTTHTVEATAMLLMETVARITQFDRVMLYKFLPEWHGEVIAESLRPGIEGFLGLRFPATDIPANARRLYLLNWQRAIADIYAETIPILTTPGCAPIDFTYSQLRAVHPAHIQYLKNIGTVASFSLSLVVAGKLWGLIACHHLGAAKPSLAQRQLCEQLSRMTSIHMVDLNAMAIEKSRFGYREALAEVKGALKNQDPDKRALSTQLTPLRHIFKAYGIWAYLDNQNYYSGDIPDDTSLSILRNWLETYDKSSVAASHQIHPTLAKHPALVRFASGILYIPLPDQDFLVLMRPEQTETVNWAGKPQILAGELDSLLELTPRASFQQWSQQVQGTAEPWGEADIEAAIKFRELLMEHIERIQLESLALHDFLTGLANRHLFEKKLQEAVKLSIRNDSLSAVYMLDLDKFKPVNDTLGHAAGDELLMQVAERLRGIVRERDVVARLGGDEFAIIQFYLSDAHNAQLTAERILAEVRRPFAIRNQKIEIGVSIGVAICPFHSTEEYELVHSADLALYQAKQAGRNVFKIFSHNMLSEKEKKESVRVALERAFAQEEFSFVYQPIVSARSKTLHAFEAFARWVHPEKGLLPAATFIPLIEQTQLSLQLAEWGIRHLIFQGKQWQRQGLALVPVSLNMTARQFLSLDIVRLCTSLSQEYDISLEWLRFDLDEGVLQSGFQRITEKITALMELGVLINIDHFGQDPIALSRMASLKINQLKIPGELFKKDDRAMQNDALITIIKSIGRVIHVPIVGTQIETEDMEKYAADSGIEFLQGYALGACLTADEAAAWLRHKTEE